MAIQAIIDHTIKTMNQLPENQAKEIADFADFISKRYEEHQLTQSLQKMMAGSNSFDFLNNEEDIYSEADLKEVYNG